jgi:hypothetical protein
MIVEGVDGDESPPMNMDETDEGVQDTYPAFDDDLDSEVDDFTIEEGDRVFMAMVHPVDPHHFVCASSMVSGCLAEAFACKGNLTNLRRELYLSLAKGNPK